MFIFLQQNYVSTIGVDFKIRSIDVDGRAVKLQIWDTAGQERFQSITSNYYHGSHAIAIVYDITNRDSFDHVRKWVNEVDRLANPQVCKLIVGNKIDLEEKRQVRRDEGQAFADSLGVPFLETSAKNSTNVSQMFVQMCQAIANRRGTSKGFNTVTPTTNLRGNQVGGSKCPC